MKKETIKNLFQISSPRIFKQGEYICAEGEPGSEMYIVLKGRVGVCISSFLEDSVRVAQAGPGEFFGEMAIFENKPRSASCVAEEETQCIAVGRENLGRLIELCPEIAEKMIVGLSNRVRTMNDQLYKVKPAKTPVAAIPFEIPKEHRSSGLKEDSDLKYVSTVNVKCPVCNKLIPVRNIRFNELGPARVREDQRRTYRGLNVLWHYIRSCPECGYSNYYISFFKMPDGITREEVVRVMNEQNKYIEKRGRAEDRFDRVAEGYYRAIHFNRCLNGGDTLLLGKLWLYLSWLYQDAVIPDMETYCRRQALDFYCATYRENSYLLRSEFNEQQCAVVIAEMYWQEEEYDKAKFYYHEALKYGNQNLTQQAYDRIYELRDMEREGRLPGKKQDGRTDDI